MSPSAKPEARDVVGVHEDHPAAALDAAVAVVEAVDRGVELVVAAQRLQQQPALGHLEHLERAHREDRLAGLGRERPRCPAAGAAARSRRAGRPSRRTPRSPGTTCAIRCRIVGVVGAERRPRDPVRRSPSVACGERQTMSTSDRRCSDAGSSGPCEACTADIESSTVTRCSPAAGAGPARCGRAPAGSAPSRPCTTCERFSLVETCTVSSALRIASSVTSVSGAAETKLPPIPMNTFALPSRSARIDVDGVEAVLARRLEAELVAQRVEEVVGRPLPDAHGAVALDVGVAAHRAQAGAGLADVALQQRDVDELLDRGDRVAVLGDAPSPSRCTVAPESREHPRPPPRSARGSARSPRSHGSQSRSRDVRGPLLEAGGVLAR